MGNIPRTNPGEIIKKLSRNPWKHVIQKILSKIEDRFLEEPWKIAENALWRNYWKMLEKTVRKNPGLDAR